MSDQVNPGNTPMEKNKSRFRFQMPALHIKPLLALFLMSSLVLILIGFIVEGELAQDVTGRVVSRWWKLFSDLLKTVGLALFVAFVFDFILESQSFFEYFKDKLRRVVVSKEFVVSLSDPEKINLLKSIKPNEEQVKVYLKTIIRPSQELIKLYSNVETYYDLFTEAAIQLTSANFNSGMLILVDARHDFSKKMVYLENESTYRVYKPSGNHIPLSLTFQNEDSTLISTIITTPDGQEQAIVAQPVPEERKPPSFAACQKLYLPEIPLPLQELEYLNVRRKSREYCHDHWGIFSYHALEPTDGVTIQVRCHDGITIRQCIPYTTDHQFRIELNDEHTQLSAAYPFWLRPGFGINVVLALPQPGA